MVTATKARTRPSRKPLKDGRDEANIALFPISVSTYQQPLEEGGRKVFKKTFPSQRWDNDRKQWVDQSITLKSNSDDGLPVPFDEHFTVALLGLAWEQTRCQDTKVSFTPHEVFDVMRLHAKGDNYDRLHDSLRRLKALTITYENAYWDAASNEYHDEYAHGIIDSYRFYRPKKKQGTTKAPKSWVRLNKDFFQQLTDGILVHLDLEAYFSLKRPTARRMFRILNRAFTRNSHYEADLKSFAIGHVGLSPDYANPKIKEKLADAIGELETQHLIQPVDNGKRYTKIKRGIWRIAFDQYQETKQLEAPTPKTNLTATLIERGVSAGVAARLARSFSAEHIQHKLEYLDFLTETPTETTPTNPAGWLKKAIEQDYQPPPHFDTKEQRAAKKKQVEQRKSKRQQQDQKLREEKDAEIARLDSYYLTLPAKDRQQLEQDAFDEANQFTLKRYREAEKSDDQEDLDMWRDIIIRDHVRKII